MNDLLGTRPLELSNRHGAINRDRFSERLDALNFVHGLGCEVRLSAMWARQHRDVLNHEQGISVTKAASNFAKLDALPDLVEMP
ncbi:MAG: hypothetical protein ACRERV_10740 [Methylococcales bacterium]